MIPDDWWTSGYCSSFAAALKRRYGGELWAGVNHSERYPADDELYHAYCVIDGLAYDADGAHSIEEASDVSGGRYPIPDMDINLGVIMLWLKVDEAWFEKYHQDYSPDHFVAVNRYIAHHPELFAKLKRVGKKKKLSETEVG